MAISDDFASALMRQSIDLLRFEVGQRQTLLKLFERLERELLDLLRRRDPTEPALSAFQLRRAEALLREVRSIIGEYYRRIHRTQIAELKGLAITEAASIQALGAELVVDGLFGVSVPEATLRAMVDDEILAGRPLREWWRRQAQATWQRYGDAMRAGILRGDSTSDIVRALRGTPARRYQDGIFAASKRDLHTLVRTSVQSVANEARLETFLANRDVLRGMEWLTALDDAVCPICRPLNGQNWTLDGRRFPGTKLAFPGAPPAPHPNCRCQLLPIVKSSGELARAKGPRFAQAIRDLPDEIRAKLDGAEAEKTNYAAWLKRQPLETQREVLGPARLKLFQQGKLTLQQMVSQEGQPLTLEELQSLRRGA